MFTLADVVEGVSGRRIEALAQRSIKNVVIDSRQAFRDDLFVALPGERQDGHDYVGHAFGRGALAALVHYDRVPNLEGLEVGRFDARLPAAEQIAPLTFPLLIRVDDTLTALQRLSAYWRTKFNLRVIGVTGSVGKTTTKELIAQVLSARYRTLKSEGNYNNEIGVPLTLLRLRPEHERAVIEMGMYGLGEIAAYCRWAKPQVGVVTIVAPVHLERLGTIENIAKAKSELPAALPPAELGGVAILNDDDERVRAMAAVTSARVVTYGLTPRAHVWASSIESFGLDGISFTLHYGRERQLAKLPLIGRHSVQTALRAAAVGLVEGMNLIEIVEALRTPPAQLRLVTAKGPFNSIVLDDTYNASAESTIAALNLLAEIEGIGPRIAVLGDMLELGDTEKQAHDEVGCRAALVAQYVIGVGERSRWTCRAAVECGAPPERVFHVMTNGEALEVLNAIVRERCVILVKGSRGMKMEEIVAGLGGLANEN
ncbi:MAG: UDP-N-acetylmuramoyl-tripeptide--D-alanyl-D-alanine ligase [Candidatus Roseilinea sp.]|nr:MAG: UDP-N-acetylmuramoyl-tripeptide--D-alanyl-D-alanine ligase [Candidatus Roseilinea sp.]